METKELRNRYRLQRLGVWTAMLVLGISVTARGQDAEAGKELIRQAFAKTKTAKVLVDYTQIVELCQQAKQANLDQNLVDYASELQSWAHNRRGELYSEQAAELAGAGQIDRGHKADEMALQEFETAVDLNAKYWKAIHNRGVSYAVINKFDEAIADFSRTVELKPDYANAWFNRGEIMYEKGRFEEAVNDYGHALQLKPNDHEVYTRRGHAQFQLKRFRESLADYNKAVELAPNDAETIVNRGDAYRSLGQWDRAAADYRRATDLDRDNSHAMQSAAWLMATCPDTRYRSSELALKAAQRAIDLEAELDFRALDTLAAAYANAGQFDQAKTTLTKAIAAAPQDELPGMQRRMQLYLQSQPYREGQ